MVSIWACFGAYSVYPLYPLRSLELASYLHSLSPHWLLGGARYLNAKSYSENVIQIISYVNDCLWSWAGLHSLQLYT